MFMKNESVVFLLMKGYHSVDRISPRKVHDNEKFSRGFSVLFTLICHRAEKKIYICFRYYPRILQTDT